MKRFGRRILGGAYLLVNYLVALPLWFIGAVIWLLYYRRKHGILAAYVALNNHTDKLAEYGQKALDWIRA